MDCGWYPFPFQPLLWETRYLGNNTVPPNHIKMASKIMHGRREGETRGNLASFSSIFYAVQDLMLRFIISICRSDRQHRPRRSWSAWGRNTSLAFYLAYVYSRFFTIKHNQRFILCRFRWQCYNRQTGSEFITALQDIMKKPFACNRSKRRERCYKKSRKKWWKTGIIR